MTYLLIVSYKNGDVAYYGPFRTKESAEDWAISYVDTSRPSRWHIAPISDPTKC